jgi:hypothetical protein
MHRSKKTRLLAIGTVAGVLTVLLPTAAAAAPPHRSPFPRIQQSAAYDSATGQVVQFGGLTDVQKVYLHHDTWTWDGTGWTQQHPAHSPSARTDAGMAYDVREGTIVLFGGDPGPTGDTWTWDGSDWTRQHPAHSPPPRDAADMSYDAADGTIVLFGGYDGSYLNDTWTWNGSDWTRQHPAHSPPVRIGGGMAYDDADGRVVLFGGGSNSGLYGDTWTWDGSDWTQQHPAHSPSPRVDWGMVSYDATDGNVVLFGGVAGGIHYYGDTWTWDGSDWTRQHPAHSPPRRAESTTAYDADRGQVLLFGGDGPESRGFTEFGDTWTWDGTDWTQRLGASMSVTPRSGKPGASVQVVLWGFASREQVRLYFVDSAGGKMPLGRVKMDRSGGSFVAVTIPGGATTGLQRLKARGTTTGQVVRVGFVVT